MPSTHPHYSSPPDWLGVLPRNKERSGNRITREKHESSYNLHSSPGVKECLFRVNGPKKKIYV